MLTPAGPEPVAYLPMVSSGPVVYGWKALGNPSQCRLSGSDGTSGFWGINPDWWYDWGAFEPGPSASQEWPEPDALAAQMAVGLQDPQYVPMIWCPSDVRAGITSYQAAALARRYPGRAWLMFNEPDNTDGECGHAIDVARDAAGRQRFSFFADRDWAGLGKYLAQQYVLYADSIKAADPSARLLPLGLLQLPMPTLPGVEWGDRAIQIWNAFLGELADRHQAIDGIAIHAYPGNRSTRHAGCLDSPLDPACVQEALADAHRFFQGTGGAISQNQHISMTVGITIWITEIGVLASDWAMAPAAVRDGFAAPMLAWFNAHARPGQDCQYINAVAWFSTHWYYGGGDATASDLLDYLLPADQRRLTGVGELWRDATCTGCACPGPDCAREGP